MGETAVTDLFGRLAVTYSSLSEVYESTIAGRFGGQVFIIQLLSVIVATTNSVFRVAA